MRQVLQFVHPNQYHLISIVFQNQCLVQIPSLPQREVAMVEVAGLRAGFAIFLLR